MNEQIQVEPQEMLCWSCGTKEKIWTFPGRHFCLAYCPKCTTETAFIIEERMP